MYDAREHLQVPAATAASYRAYQLEQHLLANSACVAFLVVLGLGDVVDAEILLSCMMLL